MGSLEMTCLDLECGGGHGSSAVGNDGKDENLCFSKTEEGPCSSQSYLAADRRVSSVVATDCVVDIDQSGVDEVRISVETMERECRICMLSLDSESGIAIELGCSCKNEMAAVHQQCAETWFTSKGNRICEICKSIAQNVVIPIDTKSRQQISQVNRFVTNAVSMPVLEQRNTFSSNAIAVPVSGSSASSTDASSFSEFERNTFSRNEDLAPVSSTSERDLVPTFID
ncbi:RING-CH-type domain-containing protein [Heracleum sosnowskyi]|uniref:RING-CH-type domain-containing protein n=1 Tax=Heracleum sosnowskyi TaxID=360622 RepID=A0AAD8LZ57_9APIA|nr:RING-CH-type domain-containing protein [Heracleum sosnowskyi]